jgi:hypothetical protein
LAHTNGPICPNVTRAAIFLRPPTGGADCKYLPEMESNESPFFPSKYSPDKTSYPVDSRPGQQTVVFTTLL